MSDSNQHLAHTLRALRHARGWSLDQAAGHTGVSKAMLGQIERGESSPTVATLWKIADGFQAAMSALLEPAPPGQADPLLVRHAADLKRQVTDGGMRVAPLFPFEPRFGFEMLEVTLLPGYARQADPHEAGVTEHVLVVRGALEIRVEGRWIALADGECLRFAADRPHGYRNLGTAEAVFHNLIHYAGRWGLPGDESVG
jgi:transcriptional regulator with XRE-family HTH domain